MKIRNYLIVLVAGLLFSGCGTTTQMTNKKSGYRKTTARVTYYCASEDRKYRNKIAVSPKLRAKEGVTVAVSPKEISYWTKIRIPFLGKWFKNNGIFTAQDTGKHVRSRKASQGKYPVVDVYVDSRKKMNMYAAIIPPYLDIEY